MTANPTPWTKPPPLFPSAQLILLRTHAGPVTFTVTYGDADFDASTLAVGDITVDSSGTAAAAQVDVAGTGSTRTVTLSGLSGSGTLGISIAPGTATDHAGNSAPGGGSSYGAVVDLWAYVSVYSFTNGSDGNIPQGGLVLAGDGNFYGVTLESGDNNSGTVFRVATNGSLTVLRSLDFFNDGATPYGGLALAATVCSTARRAGRSQRRRHDFPCLHQWRFRGHPQLFQLRLDRWL